MGGKLLKSMKRFYIDRGDVAGYTEFFFFGQRID